MKTLYVSDLDGTLLRADESISDYTNKTIQRLSEKGILFTYATARSFVTAKRVTGEIDIKIPVVIYNGTFVVDPVTGERLLENYFEETIYEAIEDLYANEIYPIVYAVIDGVEHFSYIEERCTEGMKKFLKTREGDPRTRIVHTLEELKKGNIFYVTCIDTPEKLYPMYAKYKDFFQVIYDRDIYSKEQWLELMPQSATKANGIKQLKEYLGCGRVVVFGDGRNDIGMFDMADEGYAMENAADVLKEKATGIILSNEEDGVAKWIEKHELTELFRARDAS